jgi:Holliday junction DNA helicase RuvB
MSGQPGLGKTTLARIVTSEMGGRWIEMVGSSLKNATEMSAQLMELRANDVPFIDGIHALPRKLEKVMYPAMEDGIITTTGAGFDDSARTSNRSTAEPIPPNHHPRTILR